MLTGVGVGQQASQFLLVLACNRIVHDHTSVAVHALGKAI